ncbi:hypothetical protein TSOC_010878 [Tetrabaena socialis]|uniref:Uncharacterized protein n=1 Tax=Tetrabaena socialis TaxID=47790 RepID=A0A2J7ZS33_9CHLO|nr:hypothetical protein TSOC_010878 [Tetrabaena socialis]|eukprot:PNH03082.1 hypothetical protein TSOC_010878 [Tetrabaena socialis]
MSSSAHQPALSRPAQAAAILRSLPGLAERLRASPPPSIEDLREFAGRLEAAVPLIEDGTAAPALLSNAAARAALLSMLAVALRQALARWAGVQGSGAGREELRLLSYISIAYWASTCCTSLLLCELSPLHAKRQLGFALRLMRTQPLQCCTRRLAKVGPELLSLQRNLQQGEGPTQKGSHGRAASSGAARARDRQQKVLLIVDKVDNALAQSLPLVFALTSLAEPLDAQEGAPPSHSELGQLWEGLVAALRDSCVLEHVARTLLLLLFSERLQPGDGDSDNFTYTYTLVRTINRITWMALRSAQMDDAVPSAASEHSTLAAALHELLSGRCVRHAVLVLGVAALCAADGGPSYGLPSELLHRVPVIGRREGPDAESVDLRHANGRMVLDSSAVKNMLYMLRCGTWDGPPGRQGVLALMLRVGRLVVASRRAHLATNGGSVDADTTARHECGGSASASASGNSGGSGSSRRGGSGGGGGGRRQEQTMLRLEEGPLVLLFDAALEGAMELCFPARPGDRPVLAAARAECWRLFAAYTRDVLPLSLEGELPCSPVQHLQDPGAMLPGAPLPASPPPSWADALAGGWLPCLERLLRRGGEDPVGLEARLAMGSLALRLPDVEPCTLTWRHLAVLLAYGEPCKAAALVATLGKLLRTVDAFALKCTTADDHVAAAAAIWALIGAYEEWEAASDAASSGASLAALPAQSAAGRQLALMVSCATCEWLPPLARLAMQAMEPTALCASAGQLRSVPAAPGESQHDAVQTSAMLLMPLLGWLPVLAQRCNMAAAGEGAAGGGVAAAVGGAGGAGPADPGPHGPSGDGWPQLLLEEVGAVPLLGAALHMFSGPDAAAAAKGIAWNVGRCLVRACLAVAAACPREVRAAVARAATGPRLVATAGAAEGAAPTRRGQGPQPAAAAPAIETAPVPQAQLPWRAQQLRALAAGMRAEGWDAEADGADALAALLQSWEAGGGEGVGEGELSQVGAEAGAMAEAGPRPQQPVVLLAAWRRVEECAALDENERRVALALVPVADARDVLRTCSYSC